MGYSVENYRDQLVSLLPPGGALKSERASTLWRILYGFAGELSRIDERMDDLIQESLISTTSELLTDFETEFGIPEPGTQLAGTTARRIEVLLAKLVKVGQQNPPYFVDIAERLGYTIEVEQYTPAWAGVVHVGETIGRLSVLFNWMVWIIITEDIKWNISQLIYEIKQSKPGHTDVFFEFKGCAFSRAFSRAFCSIQHYDGSWDDLAFGREFSSDFANAYDYDGVNYIGAFSKAFGLSFDLDAGGGFENTAFSSAFNTPA